MGISMIGTREGYPKPYNWDELKSMLAEGSVERYKGYDGSHTRRQSLCEKQHFGFIPLILLLIRTTNSGVVESKRDKNSSTVTQ